jgi:hypothetical protein
MSEERAREILRRRDAQRRIRSTWLNHWDSLATVMLPNQGGFLTQFVEGERRTDEIFDGTPMQAARTLANANAAMLRPPEFFRIKADVDGGETDEGRDWLADTEERVRGALDYPRARYRQATGETDLSLVVFGTGCMFIGEGKRLNHLLFQSVPLREAMPAFDDEGNANSMFRERRMAVRQAASLFGEDNLGERGKTLLRNKKPDDKLDYVHAVMPREEGRDTARLARNLPFSSTWIEVDSIEVVSDSGFHEYPFVVPRWDTSSGEDYGRSPGMIALPDANTLQAMGDTFLEAGQRAANPPLMAPADGSFSEVNAYPGGVTYYDIETATAIRGNPFFHLETGANLPLTREMQQDIRNSVFSAFYRNVLNLPVGGPEMTATEIMQRREEFIREIGPVFGRLESDYTSPMMDRVFRIMLRAGAFLPIPRALLGKHVRLEYESPIRKMRKQIEAAAARVWVAEMQQLAQSRPDALDLIDVDEYGRFVAEAGSIPHKIVAGKERVTALRAQRAKQQQDMMQMQAAAGMAEAAGRAAPALKAIGDMTKQGAPKAA